MIEVVNVKGLRGADRDGITYVGREFAGWEASPLGNPYKWTEFLYMPEPWRERYLEITPEAIEQAKRQAALKAYKKWLWLNMASADNPATQELARLGDLLRGGESVRLGCWCSPEPCHADVVKAALEWMLEEDTTP